MNETLPASGPGSRARPGGPRVGIAPTSPAHVSKNAQLFEALRDRGAHLVGLCLDEFLLERYRSGALLERAVSTLVPARAGGFRAHPLWVREALQRGRIDRSFRALLDAADIDTLVLFSAGLVVPNRLLRLAGRRGVATVLIPDGIVRAFHSGFRPSARERWSFRLRRAAYGWTPRGAGSADRVLTIDAEGRRALVRGGVDEARIDVVGSYEYEALSAACRDPSRGERERRVRRTLGVTGGTPMVLYAHQSIHGDATTQDVVRALASGVEGLDAAVLVKLHPAHTLDLERLRASIAGGEAAEKIRIVTREFTSTELVPHCAFCVTAYSTVALESLVCGAPVVLLQYLAPRFRLDYPSRYSAGVDVDQPSDLPQTIRGLLEDAERRVGLGAAAAAAVAGELGALDGTSLERSVHAILETKSTLASPR